MGLCVRMSVQELIASLPTGEVARVRAALEEEFLPHCRNGEYHCPASVQILVGLRD
jgi:hypothetical protein